MENPENPKSAGRRSFLKGGLMGGVALAGAATAGRALAAGDPLITEVQDWNRLLGDGVDAKPYGTPSQFEAHVVQERAMADVRRHFVDQFHTAARA